MILVFLAISCKTNDVYSKQSKCEYERNEVDDMTGKHVVRMKERKLYSKLKMHGPESVKAKVSYIDGSVFLSITSYLQSDVYSIREGKTVIIKFVDGEILELENYNTEVADYKKLGLSGASTQWYASHKIILSDVLMKKLEEKPIQKIRLYSTDGYNEFDIKKQNGTELMYQCSCIKEATQ